jgi:hypothetical protein
MALKRPEEKTWNWKTPKGVFPQTPGANGCFCAPSGQGKTTTLISMLLGPYAKIFDEIHIFSPSVEIDSAWDPVREFAKGLKASSFHSEWDEKALHAIMDSQKAKIKELKAAKSKKPLPQVLTIIDDFADRYDIMHSASNILTTLFIRGRHFGSSCWISTQKLTAISPVARVNFRFMLVWRLRNKKELLDGLLYEMSALFPIQVLNEMYETAINDEDHSFWFINLVAKKKEDMMFIRFEHKMVVDTNDGADTSRLEDRQLDAGGAVADLDET